MAEANLARRIVLILTTNRLERSVLYTEAYTLVDGRSDCILRVQLRQRFPLEVFVDSEVSRSGCAEQTSTLGPGM